MRCEDQKSMKTIGIMIFGGAVMAFASIAGAENPGKRSFKPVPPPFDQKLNAEWGQFLPIKEQGSKPGTSDPTYSRTLKGFYSRRQYPGSPPYIPHETVGSSFEALLKELLSSFIHITRC